MYAVFGKSLHKERDNIKLQTKSPEERFASNARPYQISPEYSSEECAVQFVDLCKGQEAVIRPLFVAKLDLVMDKCGRVKKDKKTQKDKLKFKRYKDV